MWLMDRHAAIRCFTLLYFFRHHSHSSTLLPIGTPSALIVSPSFTHASFLMIPLGALHLSLFSFPSSCPSRLVSFSRMDVAPHHVFVFFSFTFQSASPLPMSVLSSAYSEMVCVTPLMVTPPESGSLTIRRVSASVMTRKRSGEMGHPCATPECSGNLGPRCPFMHSWRVGGCSWL